MFVLEKARADYEARVKAWEAARDKWVASGDYRYPRDYEERHPRPGSLAKKIGKGLFIGLCVAVMVGLIFGFVKEVKISNENKPEEPVASTEGKNCKYFNLDDKVRIQYGDFTGNVGVIIGGCEQNQDYQVKIEENSWANISNDGNSEPVNVGGWTISVNDEDNLAVIK